MKNWFFHQEKGKTLGPVTLEEMKSRVGSGRIRMFDLVYREGEPGWRMALEHPDLRGEFKSSTVKALVDRPWVCLQRKSPDGFEFGTSGPFSTEDIRLNLQEGLISYSDFVWRDGFSEWRRIGSLEDFNRRLAEQRERKDRRGQAGAAPPLPEVPGHELLKSVVEVKRPKIPAVPAPAPPPPEAETPDLTAEPEKRKESQPVKVERRKKNPGVPMSEDADAKPASRRRKTAVWLDWVVVAGLAAILCAIVLTVSKYMPLGDEEPVTAQPSLASAPKPGTADIDKTLPAGTEAVNEPPAEPPLEPPPELPPDLAGLKSAREGEGAKSAAPTELVLNVQSSGPNAVKIELRTDAAGEDNPVYLQIVGLPGQVSDGASYYKFMRLVNKSGRKEPMDLSGINLPQGKFILRAEAGELKKEARMNVGLNEASYKQTVARLRKTYAHVIWKERLELFRLSLLMDKQLAETAGGKKFSTKGLESLSAVKRASGGNFVLYDQWAELKEIMTAAQTSAPAPQVARLKQFRERLAVFSVWK